MKVCKFGGSSLSNANKFLAVDKIIRQDNERKIIVLSAIGKDYYEDIKLTDLLIALTQNKTNKKFDYFFNLVKLKIQKIANDLSFNLDKICNFDHFKRLILDNRVSDNYVISRGEYFTAKLFAYRFSFLFLPAEKVLVCDKRNKIDLNKTLQNLKKINCNNRIIIPGFYCANKNNEIVLFERGGGDKTGAIFANITNARLYENFTDVNGLLNVHPSLSQKSNTIKNLNYFQLLLCVRNGATLFCEDAVPFVCTKQIPTKLINTFNFCDNITMVKNFGAFYFFGKPKNFHFLRKTKKCIKSRFVKEIFNIITFHKINISNVIYSKFGCFLECENLHSYFPNATQKSITNLFLYGKKYLNKIEELTKILKSNSIEYLIKNNLQSFDIVVIKLVDIENNNVLSELIKKLNE